MAIIDYTGGLGGLRALKNGNRYVGLAPAIASITSPKLSELTANTAMKVACAMQDLSAGASTSTETVQALCSTTGEDYPTGTQFTLEELVIWEARRVASTWAYAQDPPWKTGLLAPGASAYVFARDGIDVAEDLAAGQYVSVWAVTVGYVIPTSTDVVLGSRYGVTVNGYSGTPVPIAST